MARTICNIHYQKPILITRKKSLKPATRICRPVITTTTETHSKGERERKKAPRKGAQSKKSKAGRQLPRNRGIGMYACADKYNLRGWRRCILGASRREIDTHNRTRPPAPCGGISLFSFVRAPARVCACSTFRRSAKYAGRAGSSSCFGFTLFLFAGVVQARREFPGASWARTYWHSKLGRRIDSAIFSLFSAWFFSCTAVGSSLKCARSGWRN